MTVKILIAILSAIALNAAAATATWYPGFWYLYKDTTLIGTFKDQSSCIGAASKLEAGWYACKGSTTVAVKAP